jgi:hypothetical protein
MNQLSALSALIELSSVVKLYVPSTVNTNEAIDNSAMVAHVETTLAQWFGGATAFKAIGAWVSPQTGLVLEGVTIVQAYCTEAQLHENIAGFIALANHVKKEMTQEMVAIEVNNKLYLL